ncbi:MAG: hypothetical protein QOH48_1905 [Actinomycetota bacterium]|nr:hypothetical protein [Actinomycetota bacterium]
MVVLISTLLGGAAAALLLLGPLVFETVPGRLLQSRRLLLSLAGVGLVLFLLEWRVIH